MIRCPFCSKQMQLLKDGSAGWTCPGCHAAWLDSGKLVNVVGRTALERLVDSAASDGTLRCAGCHKPYRGEACPRCGGAPVRCPRCSGTLSTFSLHDLALDVCPPCEGVLFDPGELRELRARAAKNPITATAEREMLSHFECDACDKRVQWKQGFEWESKRYCGSCAPRGSTSLDETLTKERVTLSEYDDHTVDGSGLGAAVLAIAAQIAAAIVFD